MRVDEYSKLDGLDLAELVRKGQVSAREVYDVGRGAMLAMDEKLAFLVGEIAEEAERNLKNLPEDGPFLGVPTLVKDVGPKVAGTPQEMGSGLAAGVISGHDSELIKRFRRAGLVLMGRSATPEMGSAFTTEPRIGRPNRNPWNLDHATGGSSGGAASLVAAGVAPLALAGDSAGSIRVPSHCCGTFGLKPTRGANPTGPDSGEGANGSTVAHVISRSVRDSAAALDATFGGDAGCRYVAPAPSEPYAVAASHDPRRLRIAVATRSPFGGAVARDVIDAALAAARLCETLGHDVEMAEPPLDGDEIARVFAVIWAANMHYGAASLGAHVGRMPGPANLEAANWAMAQYGATLSASDLLGALSSMNQMSRRMGEFMTRFDILLTPSFSQTAPRIGEVKTDEPGVTAERYVRESLDWSPFTSQFNLTGQPAMSVPLYQSGSGLPIGVHFSAAYGQDEILFSLAGQLERALPWADRRPPVHVSRLP